MIIIQKILPCNLFPNNLSISSMKIILGFYIYAYLKRAYIIYYDSPPYFNIMCCKLIEKN